MSDQPKRPVETPQEWFRYAQGDLNVAVWEMHDVEPAYRTICFLCQSAAEKFLKGYLIAQGWTLEKTHGIVELLGFCADYDADLSEMIEEGVVLNEYIVAGRYPGDIAFEIVGKAQAEEALEAAHRIRKRVMDLLSKPENDDAAHQS
jgi:HEPN domain-containing protein